MQSYRSDFLIHWTGKGFPEPGEDGHVTRCLERVKNTIKTGLWMMVPLEKIHTTGGKLDLQYQVPMTCFTENRASQARKHAKSYGQLGFGFRRKFVLDRLGAPVQYVRNRDPEQVATNMAWAAVLIQKALKATNNPDLKQAGDLLAINIAFLKAMSSKAVTGDPFDLLEESEWRIVASKALSKLGLTKASPDGAKPALWIPFSADDLRLLVVPGAEVAEAIEADVDVKGWLASAKDGRRPWVMTLDECDSM